MNQVSPCPQCGSHYTYQDGLLLICPECAHEWSSENPINLTLENEAV